MFQFVPGVPPEKMERFAGPDAQKVISPFVKLIYPYLHSFSYFS